MGLKLELTLIQKKNKQWHGSPAQPLKEWMRSTVIFKKLPEVDKRVRELEAKIEELKAIIEQVVTIQKK